MHNDYADRKNHRQEVSYDHPDLDEILGETSGLMIYQEDIMRVATKIAGFSMTEADDLRKACSKKIREMIQAQRAKFVDGAEREGYGRELGEAIFNKIEPFADYAFNKSHAYGYALIGYQNAWLKANYPVEYMAALLTSFRDDKDKASVYLNEARQMGITVGRARRERVLRRVRAESHARTRRSSSAWPPCATSARRSSRRSSSEREANGRFTSIYDFVRRVDPVVLNRRSMESLIKAGAFDALGVPRLGLLLKVDEICRRDARRARRTSRSASRRCSPPSATTATDHDWEGTEIAISPTSSSTSPSSSTSSARCSAPTSRTTRSTRWRRRSRRKTDGTDHLGARTRRGPGAHGQGRHGGRHPRRGADSHDQDGQAVRARRARGPRRARWRSTSRPTTSRSAVASSRRTTSCSMKVASRLDEELRFSAIDVELLTRRTGQRRTASRAFGPRTSPRPSIATLARDPLALSRAVRR